MGEDATLNAGDAIEYGMEVTNTGNTCLVDVDVRDSEAGTLHCPVSYAGLLL